MVWLPPPLLAAAISPTFLSKRIVPSPTQPAPPNSEKPQPRLRPRAAAFWTIGVILILVAMFASQWLGEERSEINFTAFDAQVRAHNVKSIDVHGPIAYGEFTEPLLQTEPDQKASPKDGKATKPAAHLVRKFSVTLPSDKVEPELYKEWRDSGVKTI